MTHEMRNFASAYQRNIKLTFFSLFLRIKTALTERTTVLPQDMPVLNRKKKYAIEMIFDIPIFVMFTCVTTKNDNWNRIESVLSSIAVVENYVKI